MNHGLKINNNVLEITLPEEVRIDKVIVNRQIFSQRQKVCESCKYHGLEGHEEPCVSCEVGSSNYVPFVEPERDTPMKPIETHDKAWGIPSKQAVCPKCDYYLGHVAFLGDYKGKRITYCETCGQAIDWSEWEEGEQK